MIKCVRDSSEKPAARRRRSEDLQRIARPFLGNAQIIKVKLYKNKKPANLKVAGFFNYLI